MNVLVPGQLLSAPFPNHIVLNTESGEAGWETFSQEWISEDGLYDHLVLKFRAIRFSGSGASERLGVGKAADDPD